MSRRRGAAAALALAFAAACAPRPERPDLAVWAHPDTVKVDPRGRPFERGIPKGFRAENAVFRAAAGRVRLAGARGETVAFQLEIEAGARPLRGVRVAVEPRPASPAPPLRFELFRVFYTEVVEPSRSPGPSLGPGAYPDALIPFELPGAEPFDVGAGAAQAVWVDAVIARDAAPGVYAAAIEVRAEATPPARLELEVEIFDFALPARPSFRINVSTYEHGKGGHALNSGWGNRFDVWSPAFAALERRFYRLARAHRHTLHPRHVDVPLRLGDDAESEIEIDWSRFDARFGPLLDGSAFDDGEPLDYWEIGLHHNLPPERFGGVESAAWARAAAAFARAFVAHFRERGYSRTRLVAFPVDEPAKEAAFARAERLARLLRDAAPEIAFRMDIYRALSRELVERFAGLVSIWAVQGSYFRGLLGELLELRSPEVEIWFYQGSAPALGPEILDAEGVALRTWGWIGWRYGLDAADLWECCKWQLTPDIWTEPQNQDWPSNSPGVLYYPGSFLGVEQPIPSLRLKALRRGAFDYEYLALLAARGRRDLAERIAASVVPRALDDARGGRGRPGAWSQDPDTWVAARLALARAIEAAGPAAAAGSAGVLSRADGGDGQR